MLSLRGCCITLSACFALSAAEAQIIAIKTMPFAEGDQYAFLPSANLGMGGVSVAIADTLLDPFINPATGSRLQRGHFFGSPSFYSFTQKAGSGRTLPLGALFRRGSLFGGLTIAAQELNPGTPQNDQRFLQATAFDASQAFAASSSFVSNPPPPPSSYSNRYASAMVGRMLAHYGVSLAASAFWSRLSGVDGVDQLYTGTQSVIQSGDALDFRLGALKEWEGPRRSSLEALVLSNRFDANHDVNYSDPFWDPALRQVRTRARLEKNQEHSRTLGLHLKYQRVLSDSGWRVGALFTANRVSEPLAPNYDVFTVRNEPGRAAAFDVGVGVAKAHGSMTFGIDAIYEPIWKHTKTDQSENRFRFSNSILRAGISQDFDLSPSHASLRLQLGTQLRSIRYWVDQYDVLQVPRLDQQQSWKEWGNTLGASLRMPEMEIHYRMRATSGTGRPVPGGFFPPVFGPLDDRVSAPVGGLTLAGVRTTTQQFSVSVPIR